MEWSSLVRVYRRRLGLTQVHLAEKLGVDQATVSRWERGLQIPDIAKQRELRDFFRRPPELLMEAALRRMVEGEGRLSNLSDASQRVRAISPLVTTTYKMEAGEIIGTDIRRWVDAVGMHVLDSCSKDDIAKDILGIRYTEPMPSLGVHFERDVTVFHLPDNGFYLVTNTRIVHSTESMRELLSKIEITTLDNLVL